MIKNKLCGLNSLQRQTGHELIMLVRTRPTQPKTCTKSVEKQVTSSVRQESSTKMPG